MTKKLGGDKNEGVGCDCGGGGYGWGWEKPLKPVKYR